MKSRSSFILNHKAASYQTFSLNLAAVRSRIETLEGRSHIVIPMIILLEGVHNGSGGPLYYPKEELAKTPVVWNHKPIVVYHPELNGQGISACDPDVINHRKVGIMMNTTCDTKGRLKSEAWIESARANVVDERIMEAVENQDMMEVSTGVFVDTEETEGEWNDEKYTGIARNYRPDHLALLPDKIGACSIADGAGFMRNQKKGNNPILSLVTKALMRAGVIDNEMSFSNIQDQLRLALNKKLQINTEKGPWIWIPDVYSNFFVYEKDNRLFRLGYTANDVAVTLDSADPVEVKRVTEYRTVEGAFVGNRQTEQEKKGIEMNKKQIVDSIIVANAGWSEANREALMAFSDDQLKVIQNGLARKEPTTPPPAPAAPAPAAPVVMKAPTMDEYIACAPEGMRDVLRNSLSLHAEEKGRLIEVIVANKNNSFTKEQLNARDLGELRSLARLAAPEPSIVARPAFYGGQAPVADPTINEEPLELPSTTEPKKAAAK